MLLLESNGGLVILLSDPVACEQCDGKGQSNRVAHLDHPLAPRNASKRHNVTIIYLQKSQTRCQGCSGESRGAGTKLRVQFPQNMRPQMRQWCLRTAMPKVASHSVQLGTCLSSTQYSFDLSPVTSFANFSIKSMAGRVNYLAKSLGVSASSGVSPSLPNRLCYVHMAVCHKLYV